MLKSRWHGRAAAKPVSKDVALNDVAESVAVVVGLIKVGDERTVVDAVGHAVQVIVGECVSSCV